MLYLLRRLRRSAIGGNKLTTYTLYALGEIVLVVVGILIAVQIDDITKGKERRNEELLSYKLILADLRKDSVSFSNYHQIHTEYLDLYYQVNRIFKDEAKVEQETYYDYLVMNVLFSPITQENHQNTIERLTDQEVRAQLNSYFAGLKGIKVTTEEFNQYIREVSRPFFLRKHNVFNNAMVFDEADRTFPPFKNVSTFDAQKFQLVFEDNALIPIVSELRMSMGAYLAFLEGSMQRNHELIKTIERKLK